MPSPPPLPDAYRTDPATGQLVYVVAHRQGRPNLPATGCPFCPGGLEAPEPYDVRWFPNRWPPFPGGRAEIVLYTSDHDATFWSLGQAGARRVVDLWAERTTELGRRDDVDYVLVFENRGTEVGATIAHPHGQIYGFDVVPPAPREALGRASALPPLAEEAGDRVVARSGPWWGFVPWAAAWPYALVLAAEEPWPDLPAVDDTGREALAALLVDVLARLDRLFDAPMPYMLWVHQRPFDGGHWPQARVRFHIAPLYRSPGTQRFVAAGELGSGVFFNPVDPDAAARHLREAGG